MPRSTQQSKIEQRRILCKYYVMPAGHSLSLHVGAAVKANTGFFGGGVGEAHDHVVGDHSRAGHRNRTEQHDTDGGAHVRGRRHRPACA